MAFNQSASLESLFVTRYLKGPAKGSFVKLISYLSIFAIGLGVLNMVVVLSIMEGFSGNMQKRLLGSDPHIVVHNSTARLKERLLRELDVKGLISNFTKQDVILRSLDGTYMGAVAYGVEPEVLAQTARRIRQRFEVTESGAVITTQDSSQSDPVNIRLGEKMVFVGDGLARSLALFDGDEAQVIAPESLLLPEGELPIYEKVRIHSRVTTDIPDVDAHTLFFEHGRGLKKLSDSASVEAGVEIRLEDPSLTDHVMAKLKKMGVGPAEDWKMRNSILLYSLKTERRLMSTFLALTIVVSAFSIVGVLMVLVAEKRADIGILKSMGAQDEQVRSIFMKAGLALGWRGILGGVIGGLLIVGALKYPNLIKLPDIYLDTSLPVVLNPWVITGIVIFGLLLVILGAWIPSRQATRYSPLDALKGRTN